MLLIFRLLWKQALRHKVRTGITAVLILLTAALWVAEPLYSSYAVDALLAGADGTPVDYWWIFGMWAVLFVTMSIVQSFEKYMSWDLDNYLVVQRREDVFRHVLELDIAFHTQQKSGEVIKILDEGADSLMNLQRRIFLEFIPSLLSSLAFLGFAFSIQPLLAVILLSTLSVYMLLLIFGMRHTILEQQKVYREWVVAIGRAYDVATNIFAVKSGTQEIKEIERMHVSHVEALRKQKRVNKKWALIEAINFFMLTRILLLAVGIMLYIQKKLTLGKLYFFQASFYRVLAPFEMLGWMLPEINKQIAKVKASQMILDTPIDIKSKPGAIAPKEFKGNVVLENISFTYRKKPIITLDDDEKERKKKKKEQMQHEEEPFDLTIPSEEEAEQTERGAQEVTDLQQEHAARRNAEVLHDVSLTVKPGERIAFVGHSGAGKSTLALLLNRFYDVTGGRILIDGMDLRDVDVKWWRSQIGLVLQENIMFNDSVLDNIRYARPDASMEDVKDAARRAAADDFIEVLTEKYDTTIGDRGIRLSGGQRQRIAIARAILKRPTIVILDEATSALDSVTERKVQEGIKELIKGRTSFIIAHRLSTVRSVDRIAVVEEGRITACAPHEELMHISPTYRQMVELQREGMLAE
jgi:ABC-type multidrug transport system fused ATPase/permease subunit